MPDHPKVSVNIITFKHAEFIAKALDSVLMQRTSFDYEIVVGDDCSTDGTREIIQAYHQSFPDKIRPLFREKNIGMMRNFTQTMEQCTGEYVAILEGDDYWTDPNKLQLQAEYLDNHPDFALCHHRVEHIATPGGNKIREFPPYRYRTVQENGRQLAMYNYIQTCSVMFRRKWMPPLDAEFQELKLGDWPIFALLSQRGAIGYLDRTMAHYRVHNSNSWNKRSPHYKLRAMEQMAWYLHERVDTNSKDVWQDTILALAFKDLALAARSFSPVKFLSRLKCFINQSRQFRKPFWIFNRLWPYYKANYLNG
jgi:glycosyltransferase involved in cell wall biosynthesis